MDFINRKISDITSASGRIRRVDLSMFRKKETEPVLFSRGRKIRDFFTEDSGLYITPCEQELLRKGIKIKRNIKKWDSANSRIVRNFIHYKGKHGGQSKLLEALEEKFDVLNDSFTETSRNFFGQFSMARLWNLSIVGSILLGMVMMTFIYRYLGQGAAAEQLRPVEIVQQQELKKEKTDDNGNSFADQVWEIEKIAEDQSFEKEIRKMVKGYPIEKMVPYIVKKDRTTAAFLVGIAFKESTWGEHVPVLNGQDCYNYWGYRGQRRLMGTGGHTCFNSPKDAVDTVAKRLDTLIKEHKTDTPAEMVEPWKCGYDCEATGGRAAANKWVSDVAKYFYELNDDQL